MSESWHKWTDITSHTDEEKMTFSDFPDWSQEVQENLVPVTPQDSCVNWLTQVHVESVV